jgi:hypothetical protein
MPPFFVLITYAELGNVYIEVLINDMVDLPKGKLPSKVKSSGENIMFY